MNLKKILEIIQNVLIIAVALLFCLFCKILFLEFINITYKTTVLINIFGILTTTICLYISLKRFTEILIFKENNLSETEAMRISNIIQSGAFSYLKTQYKIIFVVAAIVAINLFYQISLSMCIGFLLSIFSMTISGFYSTCVATTTNIVATIAAKTSINEAFSKGFRGASSGSYFTISMVLWQVLFIIHLSDIFAFSFKHLIIGGVLGASLLCIFNRLGGGVFTKAADVAGDIVGKIETSLNEDSPQNPAVIADNVGDNVGDCVGANSDVFESYLSTFLVSIFLHSQYCNGFSNYHSIYVLMGIVGLFSSIISEYIISFTEDVWEKMKLYLFSSMACNFIISSLLIFVVHNYFNISFCEYRRIVLCIFIGMSCIFAIVKIIEYFTSDEHKPIQELAHASQFGAGNNIIYGLSLGFFSTSSVLCVIAVSLGISYLFLGINGIAITAVSIVSISSTIVNIDLFGPIIDNSGGIAEMSGMDESVRANTDFLDAIGNTTKAITKGFASAAAALTSILLFFLYVIEVKSIFHHAITAPLTHPFVFMGLIIGAIIVLLFSGIGMKSVGDAAQKVVEKIREQFRHNPKILTGESAPDYNETIDYLTEVSCEKMYTQFIYPIIIVTGSVLIYLTITKFVLYITLPALDFLAAIVIGTTVSSICYGLFMTITGAAWDNCKKYIEKGNYGGKRSETHKAAVTGDTVGDPFKDTVGPSLSSLGKFVNIFATVLVIGLKHIF